MGMSATASAKSKPEARALAAQKVIKMLIPEKKEVPQKRVYKHKKKKKAN
jgi:hypothetical protein